MGAPRLIAGTIMLVLVGLISLEVFLRFFLNAPLDWIVEVATTLFIWMALLGSAAAVPAGLHMAVAPLAHRGGKRFQETLQIWIRLTVMAFGAFLTMSGTQLTLSVAGQTMPVTRMPVSWNAAAFPVAGVLFIAFSAYRLLHQAK